MPENQFSKYTMYTIIPYKSKVTFYKYSHISYDLFKKLSLKAGLKIFDIYISASFSVLFNFRPLSTNNTF